MTGYELSRDWFDFCFENPDKVKPTHAALYFFAIEHCNRLGWKRKFGFPSQMAMEALGIKNWRTYSKVLNDLVSFGFIEMIQVSKNQYSSNIIAIVKNTKATTKALDKALQKHHTKQGQSTVSIDKQLNKETIELINNNPELINRNLIKWINQETTDVTNVKKELLNSKNWIDQISIKKRIDQTTCFNYLKTFLDDQELKDELGREIKEIKKHFVNWLNTELKKPKQNGVGKSRIEKFLNS